MPTPCRLQTGSPFPRPLNHEEQIFLHSYYAPDRHLFDPMVQFGLTPGLAKVKAYRLRKKLRRALEG